MSAAPDLLARTRQIADATIFHPGFGDPTPVAGGFGGLVAWVKAQASPGAPLELVAARACYPGLDPFWAVTVRRGGEYVATVADRWLDAEDRDFALGVMRRAAT